MRGRSVLDEPSEFEGYKENHCRLKRYEIRGGNDGGLGMIFMVDDTHSNKFSSQILCSSRFY